MVFLCMVNSSKHECVSVVGEGTRSRNGNVLFPCSSVEYGISVLTR